MVCAGMGALVTNRKTSAQRAGLMIAGRSIEIALASVSQRTVRISLLPIENKSIRDDGGLVEQDQVSSPTRFRILAQQRSVRLGNLVVKIEPDPLAIIVADRAGRLIQNLRIDQQTGAVHFSAGDGPVLGLGEGGPQFDRRGSKDDMRS